MLSSQIITAQSISLRCVALRCVTVRRERCTLSTVTVQVPVLVPLFSFVVRCQNPYRTVVILPYVLVRHDTNLSHEAILYSILHRYNYTGFVSYLSPGGCFRATHYPYDTVYRLCSMFQTRHNRRATSLLHVDGMVVITYRMPQSWKVRVGGRKSTCA